MLIQDLKWFNMFQEFRIYFGFKIENLYLATGSNFFEIDPGSNTPLWTLLILRSYSILVALKNSKFENTKYFKSTFVEEIYRLYGKIAPPKKLLEQCIFQVNLLPNHSPTK